MAHKGALPPVNRYITTHNNEQKAVFSDVFAEESQMVPFGGDPNADMGFALSYVTEQNPVTISNDEDLDIYKNYLQTPPGLAIGNGTVLRHVDFGPGCKPVMHRTISIDFGVLIEGEIECHLDSGEVRKMKRGDVCIQRGTMHMWVNPSKTEWARMMFVLQASHPVEINGKKLEEDLTELH